MGRVVLHTTCLAAILACWSGVPVAAAPKYPSRSVVVPIDITKPNARKLSILTIDLGLRAWWWSNFIGGRGRSIPDESGAGWSLAFTAGSEAGPGREGRAWITHRQLGDQSFDAAVQDTVDHLDRYLLVGWCKPRDKFKLEATRPIKISGRRVVSRVGKQRWTNWHQAPSWFEIQFLLIDRHLITIATLDHRGEGRLARLIKKTAIKRKWPKQKPNLHLIDILEEPKRQAYLTADLPEGVHPAPLRSDAAPTAWQTRWVYEDQFDLSLYCAAIPAKTTAAEYLPKILAAMAERATFVSEPIDTRVDGAAAYLIDATYPEGKKGDRACEARHVLWEKEGYLRAVRLRTFTEDRSRIERDRRMLEKIQASIRTWSDV